MRWPGGCFSDGYHWLDGMGPARPVRVNLGWWPLTVLDPRIGPPDPNTFGTDEFLAFCGELGAEPYINVNFGTGTSEEAAAWVAYCNGYQASTTSIGRDERGTDWGDAGRWARERAKNGRADSYGAKYWGIGNEIFSGLELGHTGAASYAERLLSFRDRMKAVDPGIRLVAVSADQAWNEMVHRTAGDAIDYLSPHVDTPAYSKPSLGL